MEADLRAVSIDVQPQRGGPKGPDRPPPPYPGPPPACPAAQPRDFVVWSFFNTLFFNVCCLGFLALLFSIKARDCKVLGDTNKAGSYGKTAKCLNIIALTLGVSMTVAFIIWHATM
ncbi:interferon-induced transmembrane protein 1-like [Carettochelys insculpta]|uniref:interferon-induced transmembrane protein 1-like n=1 Tax=Carettochelys insculpta TaxID=44489 RepID=UPI003EC0256C